MTNILLVAILCLLVVFLLAIYQKLDAIGNDLSDACDAVQRLQDELVEDEPEDITQKNGDYLTQSKLSPPPRKPS